VRSSPEPEALAPGRRWEAQIPADRRKRLGQWLTPWWAVEAVTAEALRGLGPDPVILDPACGDGRWLLAAGRQRPDATLVGWDIDEDALQAAAEVAQRAGLTFQLQRRDALVGDEQGIAEVILGNPPYVRPQNLPAADRARIWARYKSATDKADLYAPFMERMIQLSRGRVALVVADTWLSMVSFAALRGVVFAEPVDLLARLPAGSFGARVGTVALVIHPDGQARRGALGPEGLVVHGPLTRAEGVVTLGAAPALDLPGDGVLGDRWRLRMGVVCGDYAHWVHPGPPEPGDQPTCRGKDVARFVIHDQGERIRYDAAAILKRTPYAAPKHAGLFDVPEKVVLSGASGAVLRAAVDTARRFPLDSCYVSEGAGDPWALCGLLNSAPVNLWYGARFTGVRVKAVELHGLPWPAGDLAKLAEAARAGDQAGVDAETARAYGL
jgi:hypothetical protein